MAENQKSILIRFNMKDKADNELYTKLETDAGSTVSMAAYAKKILDEHFQVSNKIADRQEFHKQMLAVIHEEMQSQGMKLVGALLAGIGTVSISKSQDGAVPEGTKLPEICGELPDELSSVLNLIS